jgi:spermidine synthase
MNAIAESTNSKAIIAGRKFNPRIATVLLGLCMFGSGAAGLVNEYILATVSTYILGSSIEQFSIIIATMMAMMGVGGWIQKFVSDKRLIEKFIGIEVTLAILGGFAPIAIYASFGMMDSHFALIQYGFVGSIGFLIGMEIPLVLRINKQYVTNLKSNLSIILSLDYIGSFVGAIAWIYFLLRTFPLTEISFIVAGSNFLVAIVAFLYFNRHGLVKHKKVSIAVIVITIAATVIGFSQNRNWNTTLEQKLYDEPIVLATTTKYQRLVVTHDKYLDDYRLFINGNVQFSSVDEDRYHEPLVHPVMHAAPKREHVLILGGGDGMALREVLKYKDVRSVTLVDLDPEMTKIFSSDPILTKLNGNAFADARVNPVPAAGLTDDGWGAVYMETGNKDSETGLEETEKVADVQVFNLDADKFVSRLSERRWDVVIVDFPDPSSIELVKLYSKEFYLKLKNRVLAPDGVFAIQSTSPFHAKEAYLCIKRTMEAAGLETIPYHENVPSFGDWGWFMAWNKTSDIGGKIKGDITHRKEYRVETDFLTPTVFRRQLVFGKGELETKMVDVSTLMDPVLLDKYNRHGWLNY